MTFYRRGFTLPCKYGSEKSSTNICSTYYTRVYVAKSSKHTNLQNHAINKYCKKFIYNRSKDDCNVKMKLLDHSANLTFC